MIPKSFDGYLQNVALDFMPMVTCIADLYQYLSNEMQHKAVYLLFCEFTPHPSSGLHKTVTTASGTGHIFCAATSLQRGQATHPSSVHKTVTTASGTGHIICAATSLQRGQATIPIISTQNCNYSLRYWSYFLCRYLLATWPSNHTHHQYTKL